LNGHVTTATANGVGLTEVVGALVDAVVGEVVDIEVVVVLVATVLTPTYTGEEVTADDALSVTCSSKFQVPEVDRVPVDSVGNEEVVQANELPRLLNEMALGGS